MEKMLAAVLDENGKLGIREVPRPRLPEYGAIVRMRYGSTCAGTDARLMRKQHPHPVFYPSILGHESVGTVIEVGAKARNLKEGQLIARVGALPMPEIGLGVCWGGFAQYGVAIDWRAMRDDGLPKEQWWKYRVNLPIPDDIDVKQGPMIITWRETMSFVNKLGLQPGMQVLICGSGANALSFVAHCVYKGARVITMGNAARGQDAIRLGAEENIDYHAPDLTKEITRLFPEGIDVILDAVGSSEDVNAAMPVLKKNGLVTVYGWNDRNGYGINPFKSGHSFRVYNDGYDEPDAHNEIIRLVEAGKLDANNWYDTSHPVPLVDIQQAYDNLKLRKAYKYLIDLK